MVNDGRWYQSAGRRGGLILHNMSGVSQELVYSDRLVIIVCIMCILFIHAYMYIYITSRIADISRRRCNE